MGCWPGCSGVGRAASRARARQSLGHPHAHFPPPLFHPPPLCSFVRVGVAVFLCHDVNDVFLELAKLSRYARRPVAPTALFAAFAASWAVSRLLYFPLVVIASVAVHPVALVALPYGIHPHPHYAFFLGLLSFLMVLHIYWSVSLSVPVCLCGVLGPIRLSMDGRAGARPAPPHTPSPASKPPPFLKPSF